MRWLHDFIIEMACCLKLRRESKVTLSSFRVIEEGRIMPDHFGIIYNISYLRTGSQTFFPHIIQIEATNTGWISNTTHYDCCHYRHKQ